MFLLCVNLLILVYDWEGELCFGNRPNWHGLWHVFTTSWVKKRFRSTNFSNWTSKSLKIQYYVVIALNDVIGVLSALTPNFKIIKQFRDRILSDNFNHWAPLFLRASALSATLLSLSATLLSLSASILCVLFLLFLTIFGSMFLLLLLLLFMEWLMDLWMNRHAYNNVWNYDIDEHVWKYILVVIDHENDIT